MGSWFSFSLHISLQIQRQSTSSKSWCALHSNSSLHLHPHSKCSSTYRVWLVPSANVTFTATSRVLIGVQASVLRGRSHAPLQRFTLTNWGVFLSSVTLGSTWTTSGWGMQATSESSSERKFSLITQFDCKMEEKGWSALLGQRYFPQNTLCAASLHRWPCSMYFNKIWCHAHTEIKRKTPLPDFRFLLARTL